MSVASLTWLSAHRRASCNTSVQHRSVLFVFGRVLYSILQHLHTTTHLRCYQLRQLSSTPSSASRSRGRQTHRPFPGVIIYPVGFRYPSCPVTHKLLPFQLILKHGFVPNSFGCCVSIPLIKDKTSNLNDMDNYRAITLSPVISKLFEMVLLEIYSDVLSTDPLQFCFKKNSGCTDAIFRWNLLLNILSIKAAQCILLPLIILKALRQS